jgi:hypothetical protein
MLTMSLLLVCISACSLPAGRPKDPKTPEEQTLISRVLEKATGKAHLDLPHGTTIFVETTGLTKDHPFVGNVIEGWLARQGLIICRTKEGATHHVRVIVQSIGPTQSTKILGTSFSAFKAFKIQLLSGSAQISQMIIQSAFSKGLYEKLPNPSHNWQYLTACHTV